MDFKLLLPSLIYYEVETRAEDVNWAGRVFGVQKNLGLIPITGQTDLVGETSMLVLWEMELESEFPRSCDAVLKILARLVYMRGSRDKSKVVYKERRFKTGGGLKSQPLIPALETQRQVDLKAGRVRGQAGLQN